MIKMNSDYMDFIYIGLVLIGVMILIYLLYQYGAEHLLPENKLYDWDDCDDWDYEDWD